jgi:hypothetical protein
MTPYRHCHGYRNKKEADYFIIPSVIPAFLTAFLVIVVIEPEETKEQETQVIVSPPKKIQQTSSEKAGVSEQPMGVNVSRLNNSRNGSDWFLFLTKCF